MAAGWFKPNGWLVRVAWRVGHGPPQWSLRVLSSSLFPHRRIDKKIYNPRAAWVVCFSPLGCMFSLFGLYVSADWALLILLGFLSSISSVLLYILPDYRFICCHFNNRIFGLRAGYVSVRFLLGLPRFYENTWCGEAIKKKRRQ